MKHALGQKVYLIQLTDFPMADQTVSLEGRIEEVEIIGRYQEVGSADNYNIQIGNGRRLKAESELFVTVEEARAELEKRIKNIPIVEINNSLKKVNDEK